MAAPPCPDFFKEEKMPKIFQTLDKVKPVYDAAYKFVLFVCKLLLTADIVITSVCVVGRYVSFVPDPHGVRKSC